MTDMQVTLCVQKRTALVSMKLMNFKLVDFKLDLPAVCWLWHVYRAMQCLTHAAEQSLQLMFSEKSLVQ